MWVFNKQAEEGLKSLHNDLRTLSQRTKNLRGYIGLLKIVVVCGVAGASIYAGAWMLHFLIGW